MSGLISVEWIDFDYHGYFRELTEVCFLYRLRFLINKFRPPLSIRKLVKIVILTGFDSLNIKDLVARIH